MTYASSVAAVPGPVLPQINKGRSSGYFESAPSGSSGKPMTTYETVGWTDCDHDAWRDGIILDPFAGSGTTLAVAFGHGRSSIGIDLDRRNAELARQRVGMWLEVDEPAFAAAGAADTDPGPTP